MGFYDPNTRLVITRNLGVDMFCKVLPNGAHEIMQDCPGSMKAGDVARKVAKENPDKQIGILAEVFGEKVKIVYGEVVWMKPDFSTGKSMNRYELSKLDFEALDRALQDAMLRQHDRVYRAKIEQLRDRFRAAHTGWLETEE